MNKTVSLKFRYSYILGAVLVMIMHTSGGRVGDGTTIESMISLIICKCGVPAVAWFVFMSAYFLFRNYEVDYKKLLIKKARTLLVPYIAWNTIGFLWFRIVYDSLFQVKTVITPSVILKAYVPFMSANGALWTVAVIMEFIVLSPLINLFCKKKWSIAVILTTEIIVMTQFKSASNIYYWAPIYLCGAYSAVHYREKIEKYLSTPLISYKLTSGGGYFVL